MSAYPDLTEQMKSLWDWYTKHDDCIVCHATTGKGVKLCAMCKPVADLQLGDISDRDLKVIEWAAFWSRYGVKR